MVHLVERKNKPDLFREKVNASPVYAKTFKAVRKHVPLHFLTFKMSITVYGRHVYIIIYIFFYLFIKPYSSYIQ